MKIVRYILCVLLLILMNTGVQAKTQIARLYVPAGTTGGFTDYQFTLIVATAEGVDTGIYSSSSYILKAVPLVSWTGSGAAPVLEMYGNTTLPDSTCPGLAEHDTLNSQTDWFCTELAFDVFYDGDLHGCPWIISSYITSTAKLDSNKGLPPYTGPTKVSSTCPTIPLAPYDVSWNENTVVHDKLVRLQSTGGIIEQTLPTYLMEGGKLCDGSKYDERGAYCRFVAQQVTFSTSGCDDAKVTVTPEPHPVTDKELHDMKLRVDTTAQQPIDSTCRFTYILNMY
ncbi:StfH/YfcO family fimbrial adhesin [Escherichia coli]|uniref:StfH/YfcO family fimbrial adhesin n=2 Tax=Escherichia coli TaxID=562 RepID=UPI00028C8775|nr:StfH/YfcO family fimbrial adhesin [Escherichia coli]MED6348808.1 StfH/YfcO family fimbrial adhesin [Escherichia coli O157]EEQ7072661.1 DUF2544 domain-containing protein [Escherichia coli]EES2231206.1 DUF2544 domain-containing protein [Escherichia coli]EET4964921.1 DUF2544 domain-containing protein [Escherichia coli]EET5544023.1 DUF2544 domain-containing protein [Escherichia coli]